MTVPTNFGAYLRRQKRMSRGVSGGVVKTPIENQPLYNDVLGFGYDDVLASTYVFNDVTAFAIDEALSGGKTGNDVTAFWIDL